MTPPGTSLAVVLVMYKTVLCYIFKGVNLGNRGLIGHYLLKFLMGKLDLRPPCLIIRNITRPKTDRDWAQGNL